MSGPTTEAASTLSTAARISNMVVQVLHSYTGRGPTKAWTSIDRNLISVVVRDTLTQGEQSLVSDGRAQFVLDMRKAFQRTMQNEFVTGIEQITGRKVIAFLSDNHIDPDIGIESFVLEPTADDPGLGPTRDAQPNNRCERSAHAGSDE